MFVLSSPLPVLLLLLAANPAVAICPDENDSCAGCVENGCEFNQYEAVKCLDSDYDPVRAGFEPAIP